VKLAGVDIGTTTLCGLLLDAESGEVVSVVTERNDASLPGRGADESLQDPDRIASIAEGIIHEFLRAHDDVRALGVTGQMHGILYVDARGRACSPLSTWQDGRGDRQMQAGVTYAAYLSERLGPVSTGMGSVTHFYDAMHGLVPAEAAGLCTAADYVAMRLGGAARPIMDTTNASSLGCWDRVSGDFNRSALESLGMNPDLFPAVRTDYPAVGQAAVGRAAAGQAALGQAARGIPVITALGDNQASFIGSVRETIHSVLVNIGTGSQVSIRTDAPATGHGVDARPFPFGGWLAVGAALCGGRAYAILRSFFERTVRLFGGRPDAVDWEIMNAVAEDRLGPERLRVDTRFAGTRADPSIRGGMGNLAADTFTPEQLIAGVREGIAAELMDSYGRFPAEARGTVTSLVGSGNGLRLNPALRRVFERLLGMPMSLPASAEEASFGAALLAGVAAGVIPDLAAAGRLVRYRRD
jgi:sedoheptulokinase